MNYKKNRIKSALLGQNPMVIKELKASFLVIGDTQFLLGYCVLLPKVEVNNLNELCYDLRSQFLLDMSIVGDALMATTDAYKINYSILGNSDDFLHAHIFPRYISESNERRKMPVWLYPSSNWSDKEYQYNESKHGQVKNELKSWLDLNYK